MEFEWDKAKAAANLRKHGIAFEDAIELFDDPLQLNQPAKMVDGEFRSKTTGRADRYSVLTIVHTSREFEDGTIIRIISARPASRKERRAYEGQ